VGILRWTLHGFNGKHDMHETQKNSTMLDKGIYSVLSAKRSRVLDYWLDNLDKTMQEIGDDYRGYLHYCVKDYS
jgi:hypothetical protein